MIAIADDEWSRLKKWVDLSWARPHHRISCHLEWRSPPIYFFTCSNNATTRVGPNSLSPPNFFSRPSEMTFWARQSYVFFRWYLSISSAARHLPFFLHDNTELPGLSPRQNRRETSPLPFSSDPPKWLRASSLAPPRAPQTRPPASKCLRATPSPPPPPRLDTPRYGTTYGFRSWFHYPRSWASQEQPSPRFSCRLSWGDILRACPCRVV